MRGRGRRRLVRGRLLRGWVRGFLTFAIVEEARVYVNQAGKDGSVPGFRVSKVDRREVVAPGNVSELAAPLHKASGRGVKGRDSGEDVRCDAKATLGV